MSTPMHLGELRRIKKHQLKETDRVREKEEEGRKKEGKKNYSLR